MGSAPEMDPRELARELALRLDHAVECFGADLPVPVPPPATPAVEPGPDAAENTVGDTGSPEHAMSEAHESPGAHDGSAARERRGDRGAAGGPGAAGETPATLEALKAGVLACTRCRLAETRSQVVFGEGHPRARVFFIGEAPGATEDRTGRPFVGRAGQLLDRIIENAMGLRREDVFIGNVNKCRPPGNRDPAPDEVAACLPYLEQQVALIRPEVIVTLGRVAVRNLLGTTAAMRDLRGRTLDYEGIPVIATWHPAYLLRNPSAKAGAWEDIKRVNRLLGLPEEPPRQAPAGDHGESR